MQQRRRHSDEFHRGLRTGTPLDGRRRRFRRKNGRRAKHGAREEEREAMHAAGHGSASVARSTTPAAPPALTTTAWPASKRSSWLTPAHAIFSNARPLVPFTGSVIGAAPLICSAATLSTPC